MMDIIISITIGITIGITIRITIGITIGSSHWLRQKAHARGRYISIWLRP